MRSVLKNVVCPILMLSAIVVFLFAIVSLAHKREPFFTWFYCFAWWSYIIFVEAFLHYRGAPSELFDNPRGFLLLLPLSVTIWLVFEAYNFRLRNWHYLGVPPLIFFRWTGYAVSFATVIPGIHATDGLLDHIGLFKFSRCTPLRNASLVSGLFVMLGAACLVSPLLWPKFCFPLVWGGFVFVGEPLNYRLGAPSLLREWEAGSCRKFYMLLAAGLWCGFLWEFWNFWAGSKWFYTVPFVGSLKIFEMPVLGFLGFPPFAVECYVVVNGFLTIKQRLEETLSSRMKRLIWISFGLAVALIDMFIFACVDRYTVVSFGQ
jgi:hypothetical protein